MTAAVSADVAVVREASATTATVSTVSRSDSMQTTITV